MDTQFITAYVGMGSNLGDRAGNLLLAVRGLLEASFLVSKLSALYETEPIGIDSDVNFLNMVAEIRLANITPSQVMARLLRIEYLLGRGDRAIKRPRTADLDLLFYGRTRVESPFLTLPHPRVHERKFVLVPMAEIAPSFIHPVFNKEIRELLQEADDPTSVTRWEPNGPRHVSSLSAS